MEVTSEMKKSYQGADPFPHIVIDDFLDANTIKEVEQEIRSMPEEIWNQNRDPTSGEMLTQKNKLAIKDSRVLGPKSIKTMQYLTSPTMLQFLEELTGITDLQPDPSFLGGGVHRIDKGGKLSIHADFNIHPETGKHRRLNALLYLNPNYKEGDQGCLEIWNKEMTNCVKLIEPLFNRLVVFTITDDAYHGHPEPWKGEEYRLSLAFYYYTEDRPEREKAPFHWANWKWRPGKGW